MKVSKTPRNLDLEITTHCNLRCNYCSHFSSPGEADSDLPTAEWLRFFRELNDGAVMEVCLSGGEPFMRTDVKALISGIVENRMRFSILTNGTLITDDILNFIKSTGRCNSIQVSIDGPGPDVHDINRGKGSFEKALAGLKRIRSHELPATVRVTIHKYNYRELDAIAELLLEDVGLESFSTNSASHLGLCRINKDVTQMSVRQYSEAMEILFEIEKRYGGRVQAQAGPLASGRQWTQMEAARAAGEDGLPGCGSLTSCGGVFSKMAVKANGTLIPCSQLPHVELGRVNHDSLSRVWQDHPELKRLRDRRAIPLSTFEFCRDCPYIPFCRGGCPALAYTLTGHENRPSPDACFRAFLESGGRLPDLPVNEQAMEDTC